MRNQTTLAKMVLALSMLAAFSLVLACSAGEDLPTQISGTWQRSEGGGTVEIDLVQDPPQLKIDGRPYPVTIAKVDKGANSVHLSVKTENGQEEEWILHQKWNDNGSDFNLALIHGGVHENLVARKKT